MAKNQGEARACVAHGPNNGSGPMKKGQTIILSWGAEKEKRDCEGGGPGGGSGKPKKKAVTNWH